VAVSNYPPFGYQWYTSSGRQATAVATLSSSGGSVGSITVIDSGNGYTTTPQVQLVGGGGTGASATAFLVEDFVASIYVLPYGRGYAAAPAVVIDPPSPIVNTLLPGETGDTLNIPVVTAANATNYYVVITNNYGATTSATVWVQPYLSPQNFRGVALTNGVQLLYSGTPNWIYVIESATNLTPPIQWVPTRTNYSDYQGNGWMNLTNVSGPALFFRARGY